MVALGFRGIAATGEVFCNEINWVGCSASMGLFCDRYGGFKPPDIGTDAIKAL